MAQDLTMTTFILYNNSSANNRMEDNLSESQQEKVFQVMEVCNLETEQAIALLKRCGFDMEVLQCLK